MRSARLSFSTLNRAALFLISTLRTIVTSLSPRRKCGSYDLNPVLLVALKRTRGRQRPALDTHGRMPGNRELVPPTEARQLSTDENEPHARTHRLYSSVRPHRTLRQPPPNGFFWDIFPRAYSHPGSDAACAVAHRPITSHRMASTSLEQSSYWGRHTPRLVQV